MPPRRAVICRPGASRGCPEPDARCFQPRRPRQENSALPSAALGGAENKGVSARFQLQTPTLGFRTCSFYMSRNNTLLSISARAPKYVKAVAGSRAVGVRTAGGPRGTRSPTPLLRAPRHRPAPRPGAQPPRARVVSHAGAYMESLRENVRPGTLAPGVCPREISPLPLQASVSSPVT